MTTYSDCSALATGGLATVEEATGTAIKVPGGVTITEIKIANYLGTGIIYQVRIKFPGVKTPQTYLLNQTSALEGTEVGTGHAFNVGVAVNIPVPQGVSEIELFTKANVNSQTYVAGVKWEGP